VRRLGTLLAIALVTVPFVASVGEASSGSAAYRNGRISFTRCDDAHGCQIYTANPDGTAIRRVTSGGDSFQADWSPDGRRLVYISSRGGDLALWIIDADGSHARQLTPDDPNSDVFWPRFAPGGRRILFTNCLGQDCDGGIGSVRTDGTHLRLVTPNSGTSYNLADLSPSGRRMAYMRWHVGGVKMAIYVSRADGTHERRITPARLQGYFPDWSSVGGRIVFADEVFWDRPSPSLWTVRPNGTDLQSLTDPPLPHSDYDGAYSPDGTKILFDSDRRYGDLCCADPYTIDADGGDMQRIHLPFDAYDPRWGTAPLLVLPGQAAAPTSPTSFGRSPCDNVAALAGAPMCASLDSSRSR
jgi:Tol biopolymer transport system component